MNKQELIERLNNKLDETFAFQQSFKPLTWTYMECESKANAYMTAINYVEQLDESEENLASTIKLLTNLEPDDFLKELKLCGLAKEPQKVKVPAFVAKWISKCRELSWILPDLLAPEAFESSFARNTEEWLRQNKQNYDILARAWLDGYEVEEEPKWVVKYKPGNLDNNWYFIGFCGGDRTLQPNCANRIDCDTVIKFKDRSKAEAVATLIDGTVEKVLV